MAGTHMPRCNSQEASDIISRKQRLDARRIISRCVLGIGFSNCEDCDKNTHTHTHTCAKRISGPLKAEVKVVAQHECGVPRLCQP
jgi:hypothetical protein